MTDPCDNCGQRESTAYWRGEQSQWDAMRNFHDLPRWCEPCMTKAQLEYAEEMAKELEPLRKKLEELMSPPNSHPDKPQEREDGV